MKKILLIVLVGLIIIGIGIIVYAAQTDNRVQDNRNINRLFPTDNNGKVVTPEMTYINGYSHYEIGTFNSMWRDTLNTLSATVDTMILPSGASRAFLFINHSSSKTAEFWLDTDAVGSKHGFVKPGVSRYIPCSGSTLFVKIASTVPDIEIEFGI